jgi:hypothetical protein
LFLSVFPISEKAGGVSEEFAGEHGFAAELFFNTEDLVVLSETVRSARGSTLNFTCSKSTDKVTNEVIFSLSRSVGDHDTPASGLGHVASLNALSDGTNLVDLEEEGVAKFLVDTSLDTGRVSDEEIVSNNLAFISHTRSHGSVSGKIILIKAIFDRDDRVFRCQVSVEIEELSSGHNTLGSSSLLAQVVGTVLLVEEFRSSNIKTELNTSSVSRVFDSFHDDFESVVLITDLRGTETTFVTNVSGTLSEHLLEELGEGVINLNSDLKGLFERISTSGEDHKLLELKSISSVRSTINDVKRRNGHDKFISGLSSKSSQVLVERDISGMSSSSGDGKRDSEDSVSSKLGLAPAPFVLSSIKLSDHLVVNSSLLSDIHSLEGRGDDVVDIGNSL